ncbi:hypothetical protein, partial [Escherichia coli]|uniref:hypothetical protein n=1 Tax=Escherichia coli TaxID=562 RepID=UPI002738D524
LGAHMTAAQEQVHEVNHRGRQLLRERDAQLLRETFPVLYSMFATPTKGQEQQEADDGAP